MFQPCDTCVTFIEGSQATRQVQDLLFKFFKFLLSFLLLQSSATKTCSTATCHPLVITRGRKSSKLEDFPTKTPLENFPLPLPCLMTLEATFSHACCRIFSPNASWSVAACGTGKTSEVMEILQKWDQMGKNMKSPSVLFKNPMIFGIYLFIHSFIYSFIYLFVYSVRVCMILCV